MAQPDDYDAEFIGQVAKAVARLMVSVEVGEPHPIIGEVGMLLNLLIEHRNAALSERPDDEALRRAVARLG